MRHPLLILMACACTGAPIPPRVAPPLHLEVRLAPAQHARPTELSVYVWPAADPPTDATPDHDACRWWQGNHDDYAKVGLTDGSLRWGVLHITPTEVGFAGEKVVDLVDGRLTDEGALEPISAALLQARRLQDTWYETCGEVLRDRPLVVVDADVPTDTVVGVLQKTAALRFPKVAMLVGDRRPTLTERQDPPADARMVAVTIKGDKVQLLSDRGDRRVAGTLKEYEGLVAKVLAGDKLGCAVFVAKPGGRWGQTAAGVDVATAFGSRHNMLVGVPGDGTASAAPPRAGRSPTEWISAEAKGAVLWLDIPQVSYVNAVDAPVCAELQANGTSVLPISMGLQAALQTGGPADASKRPRHLTDYGTRDDGPGRPPYSQRATLIANAHPTWPTDTQAPLEQAIEACVTEAQERLHISAAQVVVGVEIDPTGAVKELWLDATTIPDDSVNDCIVNAWKGLPPATAPGDANYALMLVPVVFGTDQPKDVAHTAWMSVE